jgi:hypothetical protein
MPGRRWVLLLILLALAAFWWIGPAGAAGPPGWAIQPTPSPAGARFSELDGVSCTAASACTAVGYAINDAMVDVTLAERWNGKQWTIQRTPSPVGTTPSHLTGVSCTAMHACTAVGYYDDGSGKQVTLAERWNGKTWTIQPTPNPTGAMSSDLRAVSCTAASACTAVGASTSGAGKEVMLAERWNGKNWTIQHTPNPTGATSPYLSGVSCTATSACTAVGGAANSAGKQVTLAERWNGKKWTIQHTPNPTGATSPYLRAISCTAASACTAVGLSDHGPRKQLTLAERWNGKQWMIQRTPNPAGAMSAGVMLIALNGVSCTAASACTAVGVSTYNKDVTLAERWNGKKWTIQPTPNPAGATSSVLSGVSCTAASACTAVGHSDQTLAERHS